MARAEDALELLLPDAGPNLMGRARDVTHFLRLLAHDAHSARASSVGIDWDRARSELEQHDVQRLVRGITDLMRHNLNAVACGEGFSWYGETALGVQGAWRLLGEFRDEMPWLAGVPEPGETPLRVAEQLLENLIRLEVGEAEIALWRARLMRWSEGLRAAEKLHRTQLEKCSKETASTSTVRALVDGVAVCLLDRGAVREARAWLLQHMPLVGGDSRLRHLLAWTRLVLGDFTGAKGVLVGLRPWSGTLPRALLELRAHHPEWLPCLAGRAPFNVPDPNAGMCEDLLPSNEAETVPLRSRAEVGAALLCVFEFRPGHGTRAILTDVAPALRESLEDWMRSREDAWMIPSEAEHRLVLSAQWIILHREGELSLPGVLGRETTRALTLMPILDADGEVGGWLHLEFEHHLLPSTLRLKQMAAAWSSELIRGAAASRRTHASSSQDEAPQLEPADDLCAEVFGRMILELGIKTSQRRWWGFVVEEGEARQVATGGEGLSLGSGGTPSSRGPGCSRGHENNGEQRALRRAVWTGGTVLFDEPSTKLAIAAEAASGVALPLLAGKRVCGVVAIESSRRRDFRASDLQRYAQVIECAGLAMRLAQFRTWHRAEFGFDLWFDAGRPDFQAFAHNLLAAARSRCPVVLFGPAGSGKLILTRWLHFESEGSSGPLKVFSCNMGSARGGLVRMLEAVRAGSLVLDDVESLDPVLQEELLRWLEGVDSATEIEGGDSAPDLESGPVTSAARTPRVFATTRLGLVEAMRTGRLRQDLAQRLNRLQLRLPALRDRREDILPLIQCLARRFAAEEELGMPDITDEALALLWRQPWEGNVRELENLVYKLVLLHRSEARASSRAITADDVMQVAKSFDLDLTRKLNSRHPLRSDLMAALRLTRMNARRINKTRAAQYLGWDPDTLVARMHDLGVHDVSELDPSAWLAEAHRPMDEPETSSPVASVGEEGSPDEDPPRGVDSD